MKDASTSEFGPIFIVRQLSVVQQMD
jgi:hypothetical protein